MTPSSAFSTGEWQDQQKKQQPAAAPTTGQQQPTAAPQQPATPPPAPQTWGQHNTQQQEHQRNYYGQQAPQQPQQMPAQTAAGFGMPQASPPPQQQPGLTRPWTPADFSFAGTFNPKSSSVSQTSGVQAPAGFGAALAQRQPVGTAAEGSMGDASWTPPQSGALSQPGSFLQDAQVDPLPPEQPQEMPVPQPAHHSNQPRPHRTYYGQ